MTELPRTSLLALPWVQSLAIALVAVVAFGSGLDGMLVWDDPLVIGPAAALAGPLDAFRSDLFATGGGSGAVYYRPLVTLSYWLDVHVFASAPHVGMHLVNLVWHAVASVLVLLALRRWVPSPGGGAVVFAVAALWAVLPIKAENIAWISGRGDVMGLTFALAGLEIAARVRARTARASAVAVGTALALLCKESMVALPALVAGAALAESLAAREATGLRSQVVAALRDPRTLTSAAVAVTYLAIRLAVLPIASGGQGMFAAVGRLDLLRLFLETTGIAVATLATPWNAELLRGPIAFRGPTDLVALPAMAVLGAAAWAMAAWLFVRRPAARAPVAIGFGTFLPVSNLVPMGLEARGADRFLYVPSLGLALGAAVALAVLVPAHRRAIAAAAVAGVAMLLALAAGRRASLFTSNDALFTWEVRHGDGALAVHSNAAAAAVERRRYRDARDLRLGELRRFHELGFRGEGFPQLFEAIRMQVLATGESHPPSLMALEQLCRALLEGRSETIDAELEGGVLTVDTGSRAAREFAASWPDRVAATLALILARRGDPTAAMALARRAVEGCSRCLPVRLTAAEVALAAVQPDQAEAWLATVPSWEERRNEQETIIAAQRSLLDRDTEDARRLAAFVGGAHGPACEGIVDVVRPLPTRRALAAACVLAARPDVAAGLIEGTVDERMVRDIQPLRWDAAARSDLALAAVGVGAEVR